MKRLLPAIAFVLASLSSFSQSPTIEGTYLPVAGTIVHQIYDTTGVALSVPTFGQNQVWDYSNSFVNETDTFWLETFYAANTPFASMFPDATHATFLRAPFQDGDSLYTYLKVDTMGIRAVGGYSISAAFNAPFTSSDWEMMMPHTADENVVIQDTAISEAFGVYLGFNVKISHTIYKTLDAVGSGQVTTPIGTFDDVLLAREQRHVIDSFFVDLLGTGNYQFTGLITPNPFIQNGVRYHFLRNNTFGSTHLMQIQADTFGNVGWAWYNLPLAIGSISGNVLDSTGLAVTDGEMLLYRENSNFAKNDILARTTVDANGYYQFDSIPYGEYRIACRADQGTYPNSLTTYVGDTTDWIQCQSVMSTGPMTVAPTIHMKYHAPEVGQGTASGIILLNLGYTKSNDPIPGLDVVVERNPGGTVVGGGITDIGGEFMFEDMDDGNYTIFVDIPGLHMAGSYTFDVVGGSIQDELDFTVALDSIYPTGEVIPVVGIKETELLSASLTASPNPYQDYTNLVLALEEDAEVTLEVYNLLGAEVTTLASGAMQKGRYNYQFSAADHGLGTGVYLVRLMVNGETTTIRIVEQ